MIPASVIERLLDEYCQEDSGGNHNPLLSMDRAGLARFLCTRSCLQEDGPHPVRLLAAVGLIQGELERDGILTVAASSDRVHIQLADRSAVELRGGFSVAEALIQLAEQIAKDGCATTPAKLPKNELEER